MPFLKDSGLSVTFSHTIELKSVRCRSNNLETLKFLFTLQFDETPSSFEYVFQLEIFVSFY